MRLIFLSLVLLNLALLTWRYAIGLPEHLQSSAALQEQSETDIPQGATKLLLLKESPELSARKPDTEVLREKPKLCKSVGPFPSESDAQHFITRLSALDISANIKMIKVANGASHWVLSPEDDSRQSTRRKLSDLRARGVDTYLIPDGNLANRISLGVFSRIERAKLRLQELQRIKVPAEIYTVKRFNDELWVELGVGEDRKIAQNTWQNLIDGNFSLQEQQNFCLDVASQ